MISKHDILQMAKHVLRRDQGKIDRSLMHPDREWSFGLLIGAILFFASSWWAATFYMSADRILEDQETEIVDGVALKEDLIDEALSLYENRANEYASLVATGAIETPSASTASSTDPTPEATTTEAEVTEDELPAEATAVESNEVTQEAVATSSEVGE